jgi:hypothetical protein
MVERRQGWAPARRTSMRRAAWARRMSSLATRRVPLVLRRWAGSRPHVGRSPYGAGDEGTGSGWVVAQTSGHVRLTQWLSAVQPKATPGAVLRSMATPPLGAQARMQAVALSVDSGTVTHPGGPSQVQQARFGHRGHRLLPTAPLGEPTRAAATPARRAATARRDGVCESGRRSAPNRSVSMASSCTRTSG